MVVGPPRFTTGDPVLDSRVQRDGRCTYRESSLRHASLGVALVSWLLSRAAGGRHSNGGSPNTGVR